MRLEKKNKEGSLTIHTPRNSANFFTKHLQPMREVSKKVNYGWNAFLHIFGILINHHYLSQIGSLQISFEIKEGKNKLQ